ncbi:MAG: pantetheine-phosphate adenylyltransferase, partial [bacterium]|nr:pantetheine-phosphate adenylyltransferase [bacterium]
MVVAVYPGSFDPATNGHIDVIERSAKIFDHVIVAVARNQSKSPMFCMEERIEMLKILTAHLANVSVESFEGLLVAYVKQKGAEVVIKGLRAISDFEYEFQMALMNRALDKDVDTLFMMTDYRYSYLSSSLVKEVARLGGPINELVAPLV